MTTTENAHREWVVPSAPRITTTAAWALRGGIVLAFAIGLTLASTHFNPETVNIGDGRALWLSLALLAIGLWFVIDVPRLIPASDRSHDAARNLAVIIAVGIAARLILCFSVPILEDDYQRYLWDGGVVANGINPYPVSPQSVADLIAAGDVSNSPIAPSQSADLARLGRAAGDVLERVNHPELRTIYPPMAQAAFALAHVISPWSLTGWRVVCLIGDLATLAVLLALLRSTGQSPLWVAIYWWNPLVLKELFNSAHMEAVLIPMVLLALLLSLRQRWTASAATLALAAGIKVWPLILLPLILRPIWSKPWRLAAPLGVLIVMLTALTAPIISSGLDPSSGFIAYATFWKTNSALFPASEAAVRSVLSGFGSDAAMAGAVTRGLFACVLAVLALAIAGHALPIIVPRDVMQRAALTVAALVLLSPAQFPWYMTWLLPLLVFLPSRGLLAVTAFVPGYYAAFHLHFNDTFDTYRGVVAAAIWLPIWLWIAADVRRWATAPRSNVGRQPTVTSGPALL